MAFPEFVQLRFETDIENISEKPDYVLASSSLQYLANFEEHFRKLSMLDAEFFCIDRTPSHRTERNEFISSASTERMTDTHIARLIHLPVVLGFLQASISTELSSRKRVLFR